MPSLPPSLVVAIAVAITIVIAWGLLGPRRRADRSGPHVDLADRKRGEDPDAEPGPSDDHP